MRINKRRMNYGCVPLMLISILMFTSIVRAQPAMPDREKFGGTLIIAIDREPRALDCRYLGGNWRERPGFNQIYDRLVDFGASGEKELVPQLATSWKRVDDVSWLVSIRRGVKYHNGKEMTAKDIKTQLDWIKTPEGWRPVRNREYLSPLKSVEIVDPFTLKMTLKYPNYALFEPYILLKGLRGLGDPEQILAHGRRPVTAPIATGPFKFAKWVSGDHIIIERNEGYWGRKPYLDRVVFRILPDDQTRLLALQKGEVDIATVLGMESAPRVEKDPHVTLHKVLRTRMGGVIYFNMRRWPMSELKFRQAIAMAADWEKLAKASHPYGLGVLRRTYLKDSWAYDPESDRLVFPYDPERARALIVEVEKAAGKKIPPLYAMTQKEEVGANFIQMAARQLEIHAGIKLALNIHPYAVFQDKRRNDPRMEWDIMLAGGIGPGIDPHMCLVYYKSDSPKAIDGTNEMSFKNSEYDRLVEQGFSTADRSKRIAAYREAERILLQQLPSIPVFNTPTLFGVRKRVHGFKEHNTNQIFLTSSWSNIWIEKKK